MTGAPTAGTRTSTLSDVDPRSGGARRLAWAGFAVLLALQVWGLYLASGAGPSVVPHLDKIGHLGMFAAPAALAGLLRSRGALAVLLLHALVSEPLQDRLTQGRSSDPWDTVADLLGMVLGVLVVAWWRRRSLRDPSGAAGARRGAPP